MSSFTTGVVVAGVGVGIYGCTRPAPGSVSDEEEDDLPDHLGGSGMGAIGGAAASPPPVAAPHAAREPNPEPEVILGVCNSCSGASALLADLEDLCSWVGTARAQSRGCMGACGSGPNMISETQSGSRQLHTGVYSLDMSLGVLRAVARKQQPDADLEIPPEVLTRIRLRSDGMRLANSFGSSAEENTAKAELLFTQAIELELGSAAPPSPALTADQVARRRAESLRELYMLRSSARGSGALGDYEGAIEDCDAVIASEPTYSRAHLQKAKLLRRCHKGREALACFERAQQLGTSQDPKAEGFGMDRYMLTWLAKIIDEMRERLLEDEAIQSGEVSHPHLILT